MQAGQLIGQSGNTGITTGPHLHYEEQNASGTAIDPGTWIACHGSAGVVEYSGMQARVGQSVRNDGFACTLAPPTPQDADGDFNGDGKDDIAWYEVWNEKVHRASCRTCPTGSG